ncbi:zinc finger protein 25-like [Sitodiplosis mosellana]|uniref:zinc finger protein 25-like n=1 Tax=Sitodiplosis mosellana TaxID=263140 RepID=UPI00244397F0|nr:zinc finger protein 25-like [Sitodiplosis mosellana]
MTENSMEIIDGNYELDINPKKVCRLCLSQPPNLLNVFSNSIVDGYIISVPDMLAFTVDITVTADDKLPNKICSECKKQIISFYTFKQKTKRTEQSLISMISSETSTAQETAVQEVVTCSLCEATFDTESTFIQHAQQEHHDVDVYELENQSTKIIKPNSKEQQIEFYDFDSMGNVGESGNETEITDNIQIDEHDMLSMDDEPAATALPTRSLRARTAAKSKAKTETLVKAKRAQPPVEKSIPPKLSFKAEISDLDENDVDVTDDYDFDHSGSESLDFYECPLCSTQFADRDEYIQHCREHDGTEYQCESCNKLFDDEDQLLQHDCETTDMNDEELVCVPCNKRLKSTAQLRQHNKMHDSMSLIINYLDFFPCHDCCLLYISKDRLNEHNANVHPGKGGKTGLTEKIVDESCTDYQFLDEEKQSDFKEGEVYSCGECSQSYQTINELKYHVILHASKFECPIEECGCQYDQMSRLSIHVLNKHINTKNLQCLHCSQAFQTYDDLQTHLKHFCKEKKFKCYECDKKFFSKKALITHLRTLKEKKFKCKLCGKAFKQQGELTIHTRSHTNERPFQCTICNKSYKTSSMRAAHMDSHISGKTFECQLCDKKLQSRTSYRNHMKRHTEEKKHECEHCGKRFFTRYHLKLHQSKIHKGLSTETTSAADLAQLIDDDSTMIIFE